MSAPSELSPRRLAAILAADIAGYSALVSADEEGTVRALKGHQAVVLPLVAQHSGRVIDTAGDGIMAEFSSVLNALKCALAIQAVMAERNADVPHSCKLQFRIGINLGDVIFDEARIYGDGINVAARLEGLADAGGICVSANVHEQSLGKVACTFDDLGEQTLKNIARPVRVYRARPKSAAKLTMEHGMLMLPDKPSIAVLPFTNMSGDPEQEYFADGVVEDILTALARVKGFFVIARNSSFTYKGRAVDVKQVGRDLGVRYVLEGSVRKSGNRVRITAQLIEAENGAHIWADKYDGQLEEIFDLQDEITTKVVGVLEPSILAAEVRRSRSKAPESLTAYDAYLRARAGHHVWTKQGSEAALKLLLAAIEADPHFAPAYAMAAQCYAGRYSLNLSDNREADRREIERLARLAVEIDRDDSTVLSMAGHAISYATGRHEEALALIDRAIDLNPNSASAYWMSGWVRNYAGDVGKAIDHLNIGLRLSPRDPSEFLFDCALGMAYLQSNELALAGKWLSASIRANPRWLAAYKFLASCQALSGQLDVATKTVAHIMAIEPTYRANDGLRHWDCGPGRDLVLRGLRLAGAPE